MIEPDRIAAPSGPVRHALAAAAAVLVLGWSSAAAAEPEIVFSIPSEPLARALVDFAVRARISIDTAAVSKCAARPASLTGSYSVPAGLDRLLAGTGCTVRRSGPNAYAIVERGRRPPAPKPAPPSHPRQDLAVASDVVVVATRRPDLASRAAYAFSTFDAHRLEGQGVRDLNDLSALTPSMTVTNLGPGRDKILLRGLSDGPLTGRTQSMVGLYLDDVRLTFNAPDPDLKLVDVKRIEVLRGPQGVLYGSGSLGGIVQITTEKPDASKLEGSVEASLGATAGGRGSQSVSAVANLPLLPDRAAVRVVAWDERLGGYVNDVPLGVRKSNGATRSGARIGLALNLSDRWTLSGGGAAQFINTRDTQYVTAAGLTRDVRVREPHDNDFSEVHVGVRGDLGASDLRASLAYIHHSLTSRYDASANPPLPTVGGPVAYDDSDTITSVVAEANLASPRSSRVEWILGGFAARTRQTSTGALLGLGSSPELAFQARNSEARDEAALYGEATAPLSRSVSLTVGARLFASRTSTNGFDRTTSPIDSAAYAGRTQQAGFAPKLMLRYTPGPRLLLYAEAAEGYRPGGVNTIGLPSQVFSAPGGSQPNRVYRSDELWSFEAGGRLTLVDGRLQMRFAAFEALWNRVQSDQLLPNGLPYTANIGRGRNQGVEFEGAYTDGALVVRGQLLLDGPELTRVDPGFPGRSDLALSVVPNVSIGLSGGYSWPLPRDRRLGIEGRLTYVGSSRLTLDGATAPRMGNYTSARIAAALSGKGWRWTLEVSNPFGVRGNTFAFGNQFNIRSESETTPLRPTTVSIALSLAY